MPKIYYILIPLLLAGCAHRDTGQAEPAQEKICTDPMLAVQVKIVDRRWCKEGGYGVDRISVYLKEDLAALVNDRVHEQLEKWNFKLEAEGPLVEIDIEQFFCDAVQRKTFWNCVSEIIMNVTVTGLDGEVLYSKRIRGVAENDFEITERYGKAKKALNTALDAAMCYLLEGSAFRRAVKRASTNNPF